MVSIQARLVAFLALCLFASTVGSLPNDKREAGSPLAANPVAATIPLMPATESVKGMAQLSDSKDKDHTKTSSSDDKSTERGTRNQSAQAEPAQAQSAQPTSQNAAQTSRENPPAPPRQPARQGTAPRGETGNPASGSSAPQRQRRSAQNDYVPLDKRGYPGHSHRSGPGRNRPGHANYHRHGHVKTHYHKPAGHSQRNKSSHGYHSRF